MYRRRVQNWMKHIDFLLQEVICFQLAFCIACILRHGWMNPYSSVLYRNTAIVTGMMQIFIIVGFNVFNNILWRGYYKEFINSVKTVAVVMLLSVFYLFLIQQGSTFSRFVLVATAGYYWILCYLFRCLRKYYLRLRSTENQGEKSLIVVTTRKRAKKTIRKLREKNINEFFITGIILLDCEILSDGRTTPNGENLPKNEIEGIPVVSGHSNAAEYICRDWVDEVFLDVKEVDSYCRNLIHTMADMNMVIHLRIGDSEDFSLPKKAIQQIGDCTVITMSSHIRNLSEAFVKRCMDIVGGLVGCLITGILFLFLAPAIYIQSPGPILFSQMRVGRNGKLFRIYKFRSMYMDAEERKKELAELNEMRDGRMFKIDNDPRIIGCGKGPGRGIGNFIRRTSLDEFPQFYNVLKGEMSLVGTRPPTLDEWELYNPHHRGRLSIKPGLTGMWQVSGRSDVQNFEEVVALDRQYIAEWSLGLDIRILFKTVLTVLRGEGAK